MPSSSGLSRDSGIDSGITNGGCFVVLAATAVHTAAVGKESFELIEHDLSEFVAWLLLAGGAALGTWVPAPPTSMKTRVSTSWSPPPSMLSEWTEPLVDLRLPPRPPPLEDIPVVEVTESSLRRSPGLVNNSILFSWLFIYTLSGF